jgi:tight adherence protein C
VLILAAFAVFLCVAVFVSIVGLRRWVHPKEAMDRVTGSGTDQPEVVPTHPSLVFHDLVKRLGSMVPASPKDVTLMQRRLIKAGYRGPNALKGLYGAKAAFAVLLPIIAALILSHLSAETTHKAEIIVAALAVGFFGPNQWVQRMGKRRQKKIHRGLANALDLMVVCVESGLGLDQAIVQVAKELDHAHPEISEEFTMVSLELKAGKRRVDALRNLAERTAVDDLKKLVAVLIQADRFGTGVGQSLRAHSEYMRVQARQVAEEKAAKLGVKLVFPIFFCIMPSLFVVTVGPIAMRIIRELLPMMTNM